MTKSSSMISACQTNRRSLVLAQGAIQFLALSQYLVDRFLIESYAHPAKGVGNFIVGTLKVFNGHIEAS